MNKFALGTAAVLAGLSLTACSPNEEPAEETVASESAAAPELSFENAVVRAAEEGKEMTAIFGELVNDGEEDVAITGFSSNADADSNEIHETVDGQMREMTEPLVVPAGETVTLEPGGAHFMLMGLHTPIQAGETVELTLQLEDDQELDLGEIEARTMGAGDENYGDLEGGEMDHGDMDHGEMEHEI